MQTEIPGPRNAGRTSAIYKMDPKQQDGVVPMSRTYLHSLL